MKYALFFLSIVIFFLFSALAIQARTTPQDIIDSKIEDYETRVKNYSQHNQQKLIILSDKITEVNKKRTDELAKIMVIQVKILEEYERRYGKTNTQKAHYWLTFAHEAVAYQVAKVYIFSLSGENNIKSDILSTINLFQSELNYARSTVIKSQNILKNLVY